jgi:hypothetical protein
MDTTALELVTICIGATTTPWRTAEPDIALVSDNY